MSYRSQSTRRCPAYLLDLGPRVRLRWRREPRGQIALPEVVEVLVDPLRAIGVDVEQLRARDGRARVSSGLFGADGGDWWARHGNLPGSIGNDPHTDRRRPGCLLDLGPISPFFPAPLREGPVAARRLVQALLGAQ